MEKFGYNELKVLRSIVEEFEEQEFEIYKSNDLLCIKIWFEFSFLKGLTTLSLKESVYSKDHYVILNLDSDKELQVNFKKSIVNGDRVFDIIKKPKNKLKSVKLILQRVQDKNLFRKLQEVIYKNDAFECSKDSYGIFRDQKEKDNKIDVKLQEVVIENKISKVENKHVENKHVENESLPYDELSEEARKELGILISHNLGSMKKMIEKRVFDSIIKSMFKYIVTQTINITMQTVKIEQTEDINETMSINQRQLTTQVLSKCKELGFFNKVLKSNNEKKVQVNPYIEFGKQVRPKIKTDHPEMNSKEILKIIAKMWNDKKQNI